MAKAHWRRFSYGVLTLSLLALLFVLLMLQLNQHLHVYQLPSELIQRELSPHYQVKVGGLVRKDSVVYSDARQLKMQFMLEDDKAAIVVLYQGTLPSLFQEGKGAIVMGRWQQGKLHASEILAKHDENYHPPKVKA